MSCVVRRAAETSRSAHYSKTENNRTGGGLISSTGVVLVVLVVGFVVLGLFFMVIDIVASHNGY